MIKIDFMKCFKIIRKVKKAQLFKNAFLDRYVDACLYCQYLGGRDKRIRNSRSSQPQLHIKFEVNLGYMRPYLKKIHKIRSDTQN